MTEVVSRPARATSFLVAAGVTLAAALLLVPVLWWTAEHKADQACRSHLRRLGAAMWIYQEQFGGAPAGRGSDALIALRRAGIVIDPKLYLCPATSDDNDGGKALRPGQGRLPRNATSYAGPTGELPARGDPAGARTPVAGDDDEGPGRRFNHGGHANVLFGDGRVEARRSIEGLRN